MVSYPRGCSTWTTEYPIPTRGSANHRFKPHCSLASFTMTESITPPKNKGGKPRSPFVISKKLTTYGDSLKQNALDELQSLNQEIHSKQLGASEILSLLTDSEVVTQSIFAASTVRYLQRGMLLSELMAAFEADHSDSRSWTNFYRSAVEPVTGISDKSEQLCRTVWNRWLAAAEFNPEQLLEGKPMNIHAFSKALKALVDGDDAQKADQTVKQTQSAHVKIQKARKSFSRSIAATSTGHPVEDDHYSVLVNAVQSAIQELEDYVATFRPSEAVVSVTAEDEVPFDGSDIPEEFTPEGLKQSHPPMTPEDCIIPEDDKEEDELLLSGL